MASRHAQPSPVSNRKFIVIHSLVAQALVTDRAVTNATTKVHPGEIFEEVCVVEDYRPGLEQLSLISIERRDVLLECSIKDVTHIGTFAVDLLLPVLNYTTRIKLLATDRLNFASTCQPDSRISVAVNDMTYPAIVRFMGPVKGKRPGMYFGVELPHHVGHGDCDGTFNGVPYFRCKAGAGLFVTIENIAPPEEPVPHRAPNGMDPSRRMINTNDSPSSYFVSGGISASPVAHNGLYPAFPADGEVRQMTIGRNIKEESKKALNKLGIVPAMTSLATSTVNLGTHLLDSIKPDRQPPKENSVRPSEHFSTFKGVPEAAPIDALQSADIKLDSRVYFFSNEGARMAGSVRWIGFLDNRARNSELHSGLELDLPLGNGTGVYHGTQLFVTRPGFACMVPVAHLTLLPDEPTIQWNDNEEKKLIVPKNPIQIQTGQTNGFVRKPSYSDMAKKPPAPVPTSNPSSFTSYATNAPSTASSASSISSVRSDGIQATPTVSERLAVRFPLQPEHRQNRRPNVPMEKPSETQHSRRSPSADRRHVQQFQNNSDEKGVGCFNVSRSKSHNKFLNPEDETHNARQMVREAMSVHPNPSPEVPALQRQTENIVRNDPEARHELIDKASEGIPRTSTPPFKGRKGRPSMARGLIVEKEAPPRPVAVLRQIDHDRTSGRLKGIQGHKNSCYMDATLFGMFAFSNVFEEIMVRPRGKGNVSGYEEVQEILREEIVTPLQKDFFVKSASMMEFRVRLDKIGDVEGLTDREKDPEEFLHTLLEHILTIDPLLKMTTLDANWYTLFVEKNYKKPIPTIQELFDQSLVESDVRFKEAPRCLILQTPRSGAQYKMYRLILPSPNIDVTDAVIGSSRTCSLCQDHQAELECRDCFGWKNNEEISPSLLSTTAFCNRCFPIRHKKLPNHHPEELTISSDPSVSQGRITMELFAVLCIKTSHYVTFAKDGSNVWHFMDSMADREGGEGAAGFNIPEVTLCPEVNEYLEEDGHKKLMGILERNEQLQTPVNRFFEDCYLCMYQPTKPGAATTDTLLPKF